MPKVSKKYKDDKREAILEAATRCFAEKGYNETTVDDIAKASNTSKGSIYLYFSSKEEIFFLLNERRTARFFSIKNELDRKKSATEKIQCLFHHFLNGKVQEGDLERVSVQFEFWIYVSKHPEKQKMLDDRVRQFKSFMEDILSEGIKAGEFNPDVHVEDLSYLFWAIADGVSLHLLFHKNEEKFRRMLLTFKEMLLTYLQTGNRIRLETEE